MSKKRKAGSEEFQRDLAAAKDPNYEARLRLSNDPEKAAARAGLVDREKYDVSGYSDKQISMALKGKEFLDEDYARLIGKSVEDEVKEPTTVPADTTENTDPDGETIINDPKVGVNPIVPADEFLGDFISNSFNAQGGTLTNSGNITSEGDVILDNSVTNSNTLNRGAYRLKLGELSL